MIEYPSQFPIPLRAPYAVDHDFLTQQTPTLSGYIIQRRLEPHVFRRVSLTYRMAMNELFNWWDWVHRYAFSWHQTVIRGEPLVMRYVSDVSFTYRDFATVEASVVAERTIPEGGEFWDEVANGAPETYDPPVNAPAAVDNTGGATLELDFKTSFLPVEVTLTAASQDFILGTSDNVNAISSVLVASDASLLLEILDNPPATVIRSTEDDFFRWHHDSPAQNSMFRLDPNTAYVLRVTGAIGDTFKIWGYTR